MKTVIKRLIEQSTSIEEHGWGASGEIFDHEKFAKLIVKKVFDCIADEGFEVYEPVIQSVKERFGIKE